jgi:hypothetical protein
VTCCQDPDGDPIRGPIYPYWLITTTGSHTKFLTDPWEDLEIPNCCQHHVLAEVHPVDQQRDHTELAQFAAPQFCRFALGAVDETAR